MTQDPLQIGKGSIGRKDFLRCTNEFGFVRANGRSEAASRIVVNIVAAPDDQTRVGAVAGKRYHRHAVERNRARRLIKEAFRLLKGGILPSAWIVVVARKRLYGAKVQDVQKELIWILQKTGYWKNE